MPKRRRVSRNARLVAAKQGDIEILYTEQEPLLLGWTEDEEEVWEVTLQLIDVVEDTMVPTNRFPVRKSVLLDMVFDNFNARTLKKGLSPTPARRAETYYERKPEGVSWLLIRGCPTYIPPAANEDGPDVYRRWVDDN